MNKSQNQKSFDMSREVMSMSDHQICRLFSFVTFPRSRPHWRGAGLEVNTVDGESRSKVTRVTEQDKAKVAAGEDFRDCNFNTTRANVEALSKENGCLDVIKPERNKADSVGDLFRLVGGFPGNIVPLAGEPNSASVGIGQCGIPNISGLMLNGDSASDSCDKEGGYDRRELHDG